ncbi:MAG: serine protease, partial [Desulfurococcus sp.]
KAVYYRAGYYYTNAFSSTSNSDKLAYLSYSLSYAEQCSILLDLMKVLPSSSPPSLINLVDARDLYAAASTIYSYIEALVNEVGGNTQVLSDASDYYGLMNSQIVNDSVTLLGFTIYVISESTYALHMVFDQSNLDDVAYVQQAILTMLSSKIPSTPVLRFFIEYGSEALESGDYSSAVHGFSQAFSLYLVLALTLDGNSNTSTIYASTSSQGGVTSSNTTTPFIWIPVNQPIANTTTPENQLPRGLILEYLGILVITVAAISIILALRMIRHR